MSASPNLTTTTIKQCPRRLSQLRFIYRLHFSDRGMVNTTSKMITLRKRENTVVTLRVLVKNSFSRPMTAVSMCVCLVIVIQSALKGLQRPDLHQHFIEFDFQVYNLRVVISRSNGDGGERPLGDVSFDRFALSFAQTKFQMKVDIKLRYVFTALSGFSGLSELSGHCR
jgi:hypothetical protein